MPLFHFVCSIVYYDFALYVFNFNFTNKAHYRIIYKKINKYVHSILHYTIQPYNYTENVIKKTYFGSETCKHYIIHRDLKIKTELSVILIMGYYRYKIKLDSRLYAVCRVVSKS